MENINKIKEGKSACLGKGRGPAGGGVNMIKVYYVPYEYVIIKPSVQLNTLILKKKNEEALKTIRPGRSQL
jgi:hypothetical protein